jgi:hypothetical protein
MNTALQTSNAMRFTCVHACLESVLALQQPLRAMLFTAANLLKPAASAVLSSHSFGTDLEVLCELLMPLRV